MHTSRTGAAGNRANYTTLIYHTLKKISSPEDLENDRQIYAGSILADKILGLSTEENVREYLANAEGKKRRAKTTVHRAILNTLQDRPQDFAVLNGGLVIVARASEVDDSKKTLHLLRPSIINGAQTQGVLKEFYEELRKARREPIPIHIKFELIVVDDDELIGEVSISRNLQDDVLQISIAGRRQAFEELEQHFQAYKGTPEGMQLRKKETDLSDEFAKTERLLQVLIALTPAQLWIGKFKDNLPNKSYSYSAAARCLKEFQNVHSLATEEPKEDESDEMKATRAKAKMLYKFYLDIAGQAWELYVKWKSNPAFKGLHIEKIEKDQGLNVIDVPDGILFPILAALSVCAKKTSRGWRIIQPESLTDRMLAIAAKQIYMTIANHNPNVMGKEPACYSIINMVAQSYIDGSTG